MDDIFKSKDDEQREEKINNLFKSAGDFKKTESQTAPEEEDAVATEPENKSRKTFWIVLGAVLIIGIVMAAGYFGWRYKKNTGNSETAANEVQAITEKITKFMDLPQETPTLATITDKDKLSDQTFFDNAQNGDKVLIYTQSKKAILYRPETSRVIEFASLLNKEKSAEETKQAEAKTEEPAPTENKESVPLTEKIASKVKVDVLNGTEVKGLAKETANKLSGVENVELAKIGNAQKSDYKKTVVVDLSGKNTVAAKIIAQKVGGEVGVLPEGEEKGTADILVIAGK
ncbi:LytR C-terminal domain-containing protein [Patescibacteria group bacterium]|nr:LytR C-terminal domain-containing protein [Patescibacteria group bacterium]